MFLNYWKILLGCILACALSFGAGWLFKPEKTTPSNTQKVEEKQTDKVTETEKHTQKDTKVTRTVKKPDGTILTEITESKTSENTKENSKESTKEKVVLSNKYYEYSIGGGVSFDFDDFKNLKPKYHISGGKRIVGGWWAEIEYGARPDLKSQEIQMSVKMEF